MADRRMLTKKITDDDNFMQLSASAQALYLHLNMSADDDGFCNQVSISMFKAHASVQDLQALVDKRYIIQFDSGVVVIKHWRMANTLRKDRNTPTAFQEEFSKLSIKQNGSYTLKEDGCQLVDNWLTDGCQVVAERLPQIRVEEIRIDKTNLEESNRPTLAEITDFCKERKSSVNPKKFFEYFNAGNWKDINGNPVTNWKQKLVSWENHEDNKSKNIQNCDDISANNAEVLEFLESMMKEGKNEAECICNSSKKSC